MSMKIALELQPCCKQRSGIGNYTLELARRMTAEEGMDFSGNIFDFLGRNGNQAVREAVPFPCHVNRLLPYGLYWRSWNFLPLRYSAFFPPAELTHFFNYIVPPRVAGKVVTTVYDLSYLHCPETLDPRNLRRLRAGMQKSVERADAVITISEFSRRAIMAQYGLGPTAVAVVPPACAPAVEGVTMEMLRERWPLEGGYLLCVGTIEPRKNLIRLMRAYEYLRREAGITQKLVLCGGRGWLCEDIYRFAESSRYAEDILFTGYVTDAEKTALYRHADLFVFPSLYEGFGMPVLEAMREGVAVVCTENTAVPEAGGEAACYVRAKDDKMIADGIYAMLTDEAKRARCIEEGYRQAARFSWENSASRLKEVYRSVLRLS